MAKNLMIQGTMSGAGKSILTAGILRVLKQDGYRVAPFKSQNMALNSFVTRDGKEMGRAQVVQAYASGMEPSADMNPILLKPMGNTTSQVIVNGLPIGNMRAADYFKMKKQLIPDIKAAYERLSDKSDIIVIEGAGSPVEINLRDNDIVNMGLAEILDAPVLIAGNIDPGGVFAQLLGTVNLLSNSERERVKGLIINKFRGDVSLLTPGLDMFAKYCDIPFAGIVPFVPLDIDEEDSISERLDNKLTKSDSAVLIKIAVVRLPFISNYSDFSVLERVDGVSLHYAKTAVELKDADLIMLPGTKNTLKDLEWLKESGIREVILDRAKSGTPVVGICGGFQMLGEKIDDSDNLEGGGSCNGLGLLPVSTVFGHEKMLRQTTGIIEGVSGDFAVINGAEVSGYEIHMGISNKGEMSFPLVANGNVLGTYLHGIFDSADFCKRILDVTCKKKGIANPEFVIEDAGSHQEKELDKLADVLRQSLDFELIYRAIGI
ncbi:cobyric acid synthase [Butyrivibrio sp. XPD2002]|uniref:cobyric acid synthase n=1 Tax=Butyrivibrio sp. XPD2002 TaxID=1280665 RepID=UPI00047B177E|nr:cobyric acid synthase [Butyrivibrio sp. XPD2002]